MPDLEQSLRVYGHRLDGQAQPVTLVELEQRLAEDLTDPVIGLEPAPAEPLTRLRGAIVGVAAAVLLVVGFGLPLLMNDVGRPPPAETPSTEPAPEEVTAEVRVSEEFMASWVAGDGEAIADMFTADGTFEGWVVGPDQIPALHDWFRAVGWTYRNEGCRSTAGPGRVECAYTMEDDLLRASGLEGNPATGNLVVVVDDGKIRHLNDLLDFDTYVPIWELFIEWVSTAHPDDFTSMFYPDEFNPRLDPTSIELWEHHTDDESLASFAAEAQRLHEDRQAKIEAALATAESFMDAWVTGDGAAAARLFNTGGRYGSREGLVPDVMAMPSGELVALHDWFQAVGWVFRDLGCRVAPVVVNPGEEVYVVCAFTGDNELSRSLGWAPPTDGFRIVIDGAGINHATEIHGFDAYRDLWFTFKDWVEATHPDDLERMFLYPDRPWPGVRTFTADPPFEALNAYPLLDETSIALWDRYVGEFVASPEAVADAVDDLGVARYVADAVAICSAADAEFEEEVPGLMQLETTNFQQFFVGFPDLESVAVWHETRARRADSVIARLRTLPAPDEIGDNLDQLFDLMDEENDLTRQIAVAAADGDEQLVDTLIEKRVNATHRKDGLAFSIGYAMWICPVSSGGA